MIKVATAVTAWNDAVGKRVSIVYAEVDNVTGKVVGREKREDRVVTDAETVAVIDKLLNKATELIQSTDDDYAEAGRIILGEGEA